MKLGNDKAVLLAAFRDMPPKAGKLEVVEVQHDDPCGIWEGRVCDCNPVIVRKQLKGED